MLKYDYINIHGSLLKSRYGVYIILVEHEKDGQYFYIGQTGDAKIISARSSFYRLAAHLGYRKNTQNQVYEALKLKTGISNRYDFEKWLANADVKMYFFKVEDFFPLEDTPANKEIHHEKRRKTLALETALLEEGRKRNYILLNAPGRTYKDYKGASENAREIWSTVEKPK